MFPEFIVNEDPLPNQKEFVELFRKEMNGRAKNFEAAAWDAVHVAMRALDKVGPEAGGEKLCEAMREPYSGVMANYNFTADDMTGIRALELRVLEAGERAIHAHAVPHQQVRNARRREATPA